MPRCRLVSPPPECRCFHPNSQFNWSCERGRPRYEPVTNVGPWPPPWPNMTTWDAHFHFGLSNPCHSFTTRPLARPFLVYFTSTKQATTHLPAGQTDGVRFRYTGSVWSETGQNRSNLNLNSKAAMQSVRIGLPAGLTGNRPNLIFLFKFKCL